VPSIYLWPAAYARVVRPTVILLGRNNMKHKIKDVKDRIEIKISDVKENQEELLKSFELCQKGQCGCPTDEYKKLQNLNISSSENEIMLNLEAKDGEKLNKSEIEKCIDFTVKKVKKK